MSAILSHPPQPDRPALVAQHQSYRGLKVEQNLLSLYTMYVVELEPLGLFISDSRPEAFNMAFDALFGATFLAKQPEPAS